MYLPVKAAIAVGKKNSQSKSVLHNSFDPELLLLFLVSMSTRHPFHSQNLIAYNREKDAVPPVFLTDFLITPPSLDSDPEAAPEDGMETSREPPIIISEAPEVEATAEEAAVDQVSSLGIYIQ